MSEKKDRYPMPTVDEIAIRLRDEFGYNKNEIRCSAMFFEGLKSPFREAFLTWWHTGILDKELSVEDFSMGYLVGRGMHIPGAFLTLQDLANNPNDYDLRKTIRTVNMSASWCEVIKGEDVKPFLEKFNKGRIECGLLPVDLDLQNKKQAQ